MQDKGVFAQYALFGEILKVPPSAFRKFTLGPLTLIGAAGWIFALCAAVLGPVMEYLALQGITTTVLGDTFFKDLLAYAYLCFWGLWKMAQILFHMIKSNAAQLRLKSLQFTVVLGAFLIASVSANWFDHVRLLINHEHYENALRRVTVASQDPIKVAKWGESGLVGSYNYFGFLVKDPSGKILAPKDAWGPEWQHKIPRALAPCSSQPTSWSSSHVFSDYYLIRKYC